MHRRRSRLILTYLLALLPVLVYHGTRALDTDVNSPLDWASPDDSDRLRYDRFTQQFGSGDVVILSWPGCDLYDPRLDELTRLLRHDARFYAEGAWLFDAVVLGREFAGQLVQSGLSPNEATRRLQGTLVGPDERTTVVIVGFTEEGVRRRSTLVPEIQQTVVDILQAAPTSLHLAGPIMDGLSVDMASQATLQSLAPLSSAVVLIMAFWCLGTWRDGILVFAVSLYCQLLTLACISLAGDTISALLVVLPPLIQVLAIAAGMHLVNYYREAARDGHCSPAQVALQVGWLPCLLSSATTAIGMASLIVSHLSPIRSFGAYSTIGVCATAAAVLLLIPALLHRWNAGRQFPSQQSVRVWWSLLTQGITAHHASIAIVFLAVMLFSGLGLKRLHTSVRIETLFPRHSRILTDYRWLEQHVGSLVTIEVLLTFGPDHAERFESQLKFLRHMEGVLSERSGVNGTISAATFLPAASVTPASTNSSTTNSNTLPSITTMGPSDVWKPVFQNARLLQISAQNEMHWRLRGFVSAQGTRDYGELLSDIEAELKTHLLDDQGNPIAGVSLEATGTMPLVHTIQRQLMTDLQKSFLLAFAVILVVMTILQAGLLAGIVAMLPNIFPSLVLFGWLGWNHVQVDIGSVMTASVALGVAVDDTLHYLVAFQRGLAQGMNRHAAVESAFFHCGNAMLQTSISCAVGMAVFAASDFVPTARFAWMMIGLFVAAIVGDLLFLPAMLMRPLGKLFQDPDIERLAE